MSGSKRMQQAVCRHGQGHRGSAAVDTGLWHSSAPICKLELKLLRGDDTRITYKSRNPVIGLLKGDMRSVDYVHDQAGAHWSCGFFYSERGLPDKTAESLV